LVHPALLLHRVRPQRVLSAKALNAVRMARRSDDEFVDFFETSATVFLLCADRHDPEPVQAEQQRRSVSPALGSRGR
jgi:hypothetical protein